MATGKNPERIHLDVDDAELLATLAIDDEVTVTVKGKIKAISAPRKFEDDEEFPGDISVEVDERTIKKGSNVFSELNEDEEG